MVRYNNRMELSKVETPRQAIGREIRSGMARKGWAARDLAGNLGIATGTLLRYLRGERDFPSTTLLDALRMLDMSYGDFAVRIDEAADASIAVIEQDLRKQLQEIRERHKEAADGQH